MEKFTRMTPDLYDYVVEHRSERDPTLDSLAAETAGLGPISMMQVAPDQGALLALLVRLCGARDAIEIGTFTGYSAICIARALPPDGSLLCCDVSDDWTGVARRYFRRAGVDDRIALRVGRALGTIRSLPAAERFDFAFVDADKTSYEDYFEELLPRLRPGGLLLFDNVLWGGSVVEADDQRDETVAIRRLNDRVRDDARVESVMLSISDGLTLARKRDPAEVPGARR